MAYKICQNIEECEQQLTDLINDYHKNRNEYSNVKYSEAQLRIDFINPMLKCFGWDIDNETKKTQLYREVIQEESIDVEYENKITKKNPDYTLKQYGQRCLFVEAKKASIDIISEKTPAFQIRRYGWSSNLNFSLLVNFENLVIYDCTKKPEIDDNPSNCRYKKYNYTDLLSNLNEIYSLLSFDSIKNGSLESITTEKIKGEDSFDSHFLEQIESWRKAFAENFIANNKELTEEDINFLIQRLINKIIFLRICEDREIEKYETLKKLTSYKELKKLFKYSDHKYNSGLFSYIENDLSDNLIIDDKLLITVFSELYYPINPYDFSVIDSDILSQVYEQYLGNKIELSNDYSISLVQEPEVVASNGVVPTPKLIVKQVVSETLTPLYSDVNFEKSLDFKIADICCGSGTFLLSVFDYILHHRENYFLSLKSPNKGSLTEFGNNQLNLSLKEKQKILTDNIFGLDLNPYAVEVAQFSLLLRLIENENEISINEFLKNSKNKILPDISNNIKCGNALLDDDFYNFKPDICDSLLYKINPFNWFEEFPFLDKERGFNAIVGNPPYVRIQNLVKYSLEEVEYYRSKLSPYSYSSKDLFDKYYLFFERALSLTDKNGRLGYIVPNKFFIVKGGKKLRSFIHKNTSIARIIHFGVTQVFPNRSTYTAIVVLSNKGSDYLNFSRIDSLKSSDAFINSPIVKYKQDEFKSSPWVFISKPAQDLFNRVYSSGVMHLKEVAEIPVGLQTSADKVYIFTVIEVDEDYFYFSMDGRDYKVEKSICRPCLYDVSFNAFDTIKANSQMIFPYDIENNIASVINEKDMQEKYPFCWLYLCDFRKKLEKRNINGTNPLWYQYGRNQSLNKFHDNEKIVFPVLSKNSSYIIDNTNFQFTGGGNGPYYSISSNSYYSIYYIAGLLSHPVLEAIIKSKASEFRGDYYSHGKQFIENLPIKKIDFNDSEQKKSHDLICSIVKKIILSKNILKKSNIPNKQKILQRKVNHLYSELFNQIDKLYNFTQEDISCITGDNLFFAPIES